MIIIFEVRKRNGKLCDFDVNKVYVAIMKAMKSGNKISKEVAVSISNYIEDKYKNRDIVEISEIESDVFSQLCARGNSLTAKAYEGYRAIREFQRNSDSDLECQLNTMLTGTSEFWKTENSNKNAVLVTTQRDYMAGIVSKHIARKFLLPPDIVQAHDLGIIHQHDMDYEAQMALHNCCLVNLEDMLQNGTCINGVSIEKPHRLLTATTIATQIITAVTSSQYGGATISLTHLAPFVRDSYNIYYTRYKNRGLIDKDCKKFAEEDLKKEVADSVQTFNYQINSMSTTNGQSPFLSVFMYLNETDEYKDELAMLIEEFLHQRIQGMKNRTGHYVTQAFPKLLYVLEEDNIHEDSPYWYLTKLSAECTAKRMVPDYISEKIMLAEKNACFACMGCRSFLTPDRTTDNYAKSKNWVDGHKYYGRFNLGVCSINLPDIALSSEGDIDDFWDIFDKRLDLCHRALQAKIERLSSITSDVAPILWQDGALARLSPHEPLDNLIHNGYATVSLGYAGLYECVKYMTGNSHSDNSVGMKFGLQVMQRLNDACAKWKSEENIDYSVYGSPIESTTYKFAKCLKERFGIIKGITDRNYVTNSYHIPVFEKINPFDKIKKESNFQKLSPGGCITYVECADLTKNVKAVLTVIKYIYDNIMYAELNTKSDYCQKCGYDGEIKIIDVDGYLDWQCPNCGNTDKTYLNVSRRVCGYISTNFFNQGRTEEIKERVVHLDNHEDGE